MLEFVDNTPNETPVRGFLHTPEHPNGHGLILSHGAGANCQTPLLIALAHAFCNALFTVLRCDLPFRQLRPNGPPPRGSSERDQDGLRRTTILMRQSVSGKIYLGGHSYGGRQISMLAASDPQLVNGLLLLSYPLHPPQRPTETRTAHFPKLQTKSLFVSGQRDGFATESEMRTAMKLISAPTELITIPGAGHELMNKKNASSLPETVLHAFMNLFG